MLLEKKIFDDYQLAYFVWVIWLIWKERNSFVFEHRSPDPLRVVNAVGRALNEYWRTMGWSDQEGEKLEVGGEIKGWKRPDAGMVKINCAGSFNADIAAIGVICRNEEGVFLWGFGEKVRADSAVVSEFLALKKAISLLEEVEAEKVVIEIDCAEVY